MGDFQFFFDSHSMAYLWGCVPLLCVWLGLYVSRPDVRRQMILMSVAVGTLSVFTAHYWWTIDWWQPPTITGTRVGVEDFLAGFASGGIMAVAYEVLFQRRLYRTRHHYCDYPSWATVLLLLAFLMSWLFWGVGLTSFWASTCALVASAALMFWFRRDLLLNGLLSGLLMTVISVCSYAVIHWVSPTWLDTTYLYETLSGIRIEGVPVEEFIFWFFAGVVFGPLLEYAECKRTRRAT